MVQLVHIQPGRHAVRLVVKNGPLQESMNADFGLILNRSSGGFEAEIGAEVMG